MSSLENSYPLINPGVALPIGTTPVFAGAQPPMGVLNPPLGWVGAQQVEILHAPAYIVFRGVLYVTNGAGAATATINLCEGGSLTVQVSTPALTVAASAVVALPFELAVQGGNGINPQFGGGWYAYGISVTVAGTAMTLNSGYGHLWAAP